MSATLLVLAVVAGLACPAHMWLRRRRGEHRACRPAPRALPESAAAVRERQRDLAARIDELSQRDRRSVGAADHSRLG